ncbi:hypothetical protein [Coleofasciculus sp. H7-2]|uniref:hypothetical protein n=1 Tax=Coleofasciculus sp. H7-2 TaxID=3351545 RepID=UPI003672E50F
MVCPCLTPGIEHINVAGILCVCDRHCVVYTAIGGFSLAVGSKKQENGDRKQLLKALLSRKLVSDRIRTEQEANQLANRSTVLGNAASYDEQIQAQNV